MKILILGDLHLRVRAPEKRRDKDFLKTCLGKFEQILQIYKKHKCDAMIQPGDFFDSPNPSGELVAAVIELLRRYEPNLYAVHGQHDLSFHSESSMKRSPLRIIEAAGCLTLLSSDFRNPICLSEDTENGGTPAYGASFGQEPPEATEGIYNVLAAHVMCGNKRLWPSQKLTGPRRYMKSNPRYNLYILGDYHYDFRVQVGDAWAINAGCMLRLTSSRRDLTHKPKVVIFDTNKNESEDIFLDVKPKDEVFDLSEVTKQIQPGFSKLTNRLSQQGKIGVSFKDNLAAYFDAEKTPEKIRDIIWGVLD